MVWTKYKKLQLLIDFWSLLATEGLYIILMNIQYQQLHILVTGIEIPLNLSGDDLH